MSGQTASGVILYVAGDPKGDAAHVLTIRPDGTGRRELLAEPAGSFAISPDGRSVVVSLEQPTLMGVDGSNPIPVTPEDPTLLVDFVRWSPDGRRLAFFGFHDHSDVRGLWTMDIDGTHLVQLTDVEDHPVAYSPDGSQILFGRMGPGEDLIDHPLTLYVVNVDGTGLRQLSPDGLTVTDEEGPPAAWVDGDTVVFSAAPSPWRLSGSAVYKVGADGSGLKEILGAQSGPDVRLSPDGRWLVTSRDWDGNGNSDITVMRPDGTEARAITALPGGACCAAWAPGSTAVVFSGMRVVDLDGSGLRQLTGEDVRDGHYAWLQAP